ncbi:MAG: amidohydrolase family protein, partial [Actinomycetota bacterium]|nr:amidohydrolase family protein [Actinomycetota bacterium]
MSEAGNLIVTGARLNGETVGLKATGGIIEAIGPDVHAEHAERPDLDAGGAWLCPPLVNAHTHAAMTLFRGHGDDLPLMRWLQEAIWPVEAKLDEEDVYWGTRLACLEMIRSGTTSFWDMYWQPSGVARAVTDAGVRAVVGPPMISARSEKERAKNDRELVTQLDALAGFGPRIDAAIAPHAIYTVDSTGLEFARDLASDRDLPIHIHLSETRPEVDDCVDKYGMRPVFYLDSLGLLGERTVLAHGVFLDPDELDLIADRGATV